MQVTQVVVQTNLKDTNDAKIMIRSCYFDKTQWFYFKKGWDHYICIIEDLAQ